MNETPKNVRQVGNIDKAHKIYVEDYVITFTKGIGNSLTDENNMSCAAAVLLGHKKNAGKEVETYINGMVLIDEFAEMKETVFSNDMWSGIYDKIKEFYEDEEIVGWMYIGCINDAQPDKRLLNIHSSNFSGKNYIFMVYDCEEKEELFFDFINNTFIKRKGFYIYYQKNDTMHNYMLAANGKEEETAESEDRVVKDIRNILSKRQEKSEKRKFMQTVYAAGMLVAAVILLVGTSVIYRNNNISQTASNDTATDIPQNIEETSSDNLLVQDGQQTADNENIQVTETPSAIQTEAPSAAGGENQGTDAQMPEGQVADAGISDVQTETTAQPPAEQAAEEQSEDKTQTENKDAGELHEATPVQEEGNDSPGEQPVMSDNTASKYSFYIVKSGDNLGSISEKIFRSVKYVKKIKELNNLENEDMIYEGQKLWIPEK